MLTDEDYFLLKRLSREKRVTIGALIREAVTKTHKKNEKPDVGQLLKKTRQIGLKANIKSGEIKEFINAGRKP